MYSSVLSPKQIKLLKKLGFLKKYGFYLAGGTALALQIQIPEQTLIVKIEGKEVSFLS